MKLKEELKGNTTYQDWAWDAFVAINATTRVGQGFSEISDVDAAHGGSFENVQESFLFAEVMKYSYLIHAPVCDPEPCRIRVPMLRGCVPGQHLPGREQGRQEPIRLQHGGTSVEGCGTTRVSRTGSSDQGSVDQIHVASLHAFSYKEWSDRVLGIYLFLVINIVNLR